MSDVVELLAAVDTVIGALRRRHVPYFITGSFASSVHGEFRATNDIDLVVQLVPASLPADDRIFVINIWSEPID